MKGRSGVLLTNDLIYADRHYIEAKKLWIIEFVRPAACNQIKARATTAPISNTQEPQSVRRKPLLQETTPTEPGWALGTALMGSSVC